ncbi:hypothetical protein [Seonamhaeicola marinus]|uniref:Uncharacterized protein n=1 Tax=Seonamhaeicola marinus TaxID=1912246 RepID=A0A5D0J9G5_9FLAO|nr:hypothetical protein [Seonamhaeicola marinus]TYA92216.1 hypothetical protein FUA24_01940 [Seonamhaeicola marinus]
MLTDKQSLLLCGLLVSGFFIGGILDILNNFVVLTILTIIFLAIMVNLISAKSFIKDKEEHSKTSS